MKHTPCARALSALSLLVATACSSSSPSSSSTDGSSDDGGTYSGSGGVTPCAALAECCNAGDITGADKEDCDVSTDAGPGSAEQGYCQSNFDALRRDSFCGGFTYAGFVPYTLGQVPSKVTMESSACAALTACCVSNEVWGEPQEVCKGFTTGTTDQSACASTADSLRQQGFCGGFTFPDAGALGSGMGA
jgi:hypothetical protein